MQLQKTVSCASDGCGRGLQSDMHAPPRALGPYFERVYVQQLMTVIIKQNYQYMSDYHAISFMPPPAATARRATRGAETSRALDPSTSLPTETNCASPKTANALHNADCATCWPLSQRQFRFLVFCVASAGECVDLQALNQAHQGHPASCEGNSVNTNTKSATILRLSQRAMQHQRTQSTAAQNFGAPMLKPKISGQG